MKTNHIIFRTKTYSKPKNATLSQQFVTIEKVLTEYEKKKFHPKIQNFRYMSTQSNRKNHRKSTFILKKDKGLENSSQKLFGPLPKVFKNPKDVLKTQNSYDISQITLASSEDKDTYIKLSRLKQREKQLNTRRTYTNHPQQFLQNRNNFIELMSKQIHSINASSRDVFNEHADANKSRQNFETMKRIDSKLTVPSQQYTRSKSPTQKKYSEIQLQEFLEEQTNLTLSQKRRITEYKRKQETHETDKQQEGLNTKSTKSFRKKYLKTEKNQSPKVLVINETKHQTTQRLFQSFNQEQKQEEQFQEDLIRFSNKGWQVQHNLGNDSSLMTL